MQYLIFCLLFCALFFHPKHLKNSMAAEENRNWRVFLNGQSISVGKFTPQDPTRYRAIGQLGVDYKLHGYGKLLDDNVIGLSAASLYTQPYFNLNVKRGSLAFRLGRYFFEETLLLSLLLGSRSTEVNGFEQDSASFYGLEAQYLIPLGKNFFLTPVAGAQYTRKVQLRREISRRAPTEIENFFCQLLFFGRNCGNIMQYDYLTIPDSKQWNLGLGVSYKF